MRVFLDTNILLDILLQRVPFYQDSKAVVELCDNRGFDIGVAWHGVATAFYLIAKNQGELPAMKAITGLLTWTTVATAGQAEAEEALTYGISDYEDALQCAAAKAFGADWLVTRDEAGFVLSPVPSISPGDFVAL